MVSNNKNDQLNIRDLVFSFLPVIIAICLQYLVIIGDIIILFFYNLLSDEKTIVTRSPGTILTQQYNQPMNLAYITLVQYVLFILVFGIWYYKVFGKFKNSKEPLTIRKSLSNSFKNMFNSYTPLFMIVAGVAAQFMVDGILNLIRPLLSDFFVNYDKMVSNVTGAGSSWVMLLAVMFAAPIGEEFLFRGLIFRYSKRCLPPWIAIVFQSLLFGVYHGNLIQGVYAFLLGIVLGLLAYKFKSVLPGIILHMVINISLLFVPGFLFETTTRCILTAGIAGIIFAVSIFLAFKVARKKE